MKILDKIEEYICAACTLVMTLLVFANVLSRYVLHMSLSFSDEITTNLFILLSMMGAAIATKRRAHLGLTILTDEQNAAFAEAIADWKSTLIDQFGEYACGCFGITK